MQKAQEILKHIDELYLVKVDLQKIEKIPETNPTQYQAWVEAFEEYDLSDVLFAIDEFWQYKSNKTRPNVAQIRAILNAKKAEKVKKAETQAVKAELPTPESLMQDDIKAGNCRNNLYVYREAYELVTQDWLAEMIPADEYNFAITHWPRNVQLAVNNGLFGRFSEAMLQAAHRRFGEDRDYEFPSANDLAAQKGDAPVAMGDVAGSLASHWRVA